jgi:cytochrome c2
MKLLGISLLCALTAAACRGGGSYWEPVEVEGGNAQAGHEAIINYGCGACHVIPGVAGAQGAVGPPLDGWLQRQFIAGSLPNTPDNLIQWIQNPQTLEPGSAMPSLGVSDNDARDIAAYLYTIKRFD